jgi:hypothetical protein
VSTQNPPTLPEKSFKYFEVTFLEPSLEPRGRGGRPLRPAAPGPLVHVGLRDDVPVLPLADKEGSGVEILTRQQSGHVS